ncbi:hypothetical protein QJS10_CPA06g02075 [Acorus calamus]|uniref:Uncharacterized protein n=1 Tax=Acorus calamus TaxID=4465 RepID=A0AAV9EJJ0_ACOCL|nr:hypothetical protein QJS10_CPA06g02075 [Acorus calamus]
MWRESFDHMNACRSASFAARRRLTRNRACSSVKNAAHSVFAFRRGPTAISRCAPATTTGRPRKAGPSALD